MYRVALLMLLALGGLYGSADAQGSIRDVNFANFTYPAFCAGEDPENITVKDREYSHQKQEEDYIDRMHFRVNAPEYGDLTGDRSDEAMIVSVCNTGGTGNFSEGYIYTLRDGKPLLLARIPGGDRAYGGLRSAKAVSGLLVVESNDVGELGGACCPEFIVTSLYRLDGGSLKKAGPDKRREIYPSERVVFARGTTGKTFKTNIPAGELKRFTVGARAGQHLTVSTDGGEFAELRLVDDADVTPGVDNFLARLPRTGDYTVEIRNLSTQSLTFTVNIRILN